MAQGKGGDPDGLWQAGFELGREPGPALLEALEEMALSASIFASEVDEADDAVRWRVDLLFRDQPGHDALKARLETLLAAHGQALDSDLAINWLPHQDWLATVRMAREPLQIGRFFVHGEGDALPSRPRLVPLLIEAGLAFGSGEHATTSACLAAFDALLRRRRFRRVLDMGCGSAILAIAATSTDHGSRALAVDNDPLAVKVASDNARRNHVASRVRTLVSEGYADPAIRRAGPFDLIFANILADPLIAMAPDLARHLAPDGLAVLSGLLRREGEAVLAAHLAQGLVLAEQHDYGDWRTLLLRKPA